MIHRFIALTALAASFLILPAAAGAPPRAQGDSHVAAVWDAASGVRIYDRSAATAGVSASTVLTPTDSAQCDLYTTTVSIEWTALGRHHFTAIIVSGDDFSHGWRAIDTTTWSMLPTNVVWDSKAPVVERWYLHGTKRSSDLCPSDHATLNHVEMYVDGPPPSAARMTTVKPPSKDHLAVLWRWPDDIVTYDPARVETSVHFYYEDEGIDPESGCTVRFTEADVYFSAVNGTRIIAVGLGRPGGSMTYQRGSATSYSLGIGQHEYFLDGQKSASCPADRLSLDRIEIYTDAGRAR